MTFIERLIQKMPFIDASLGLVAAAVAVYYLTQGGWFLAAAFAVGSAVSFTAAWVRPTERVYHAMMTRAIRGRG